MSYRSRHRNRARFRILYEQCKQSFGMFDEHVKFLACYRNVASCLATTQEKITFCSFANAHLSFCGFCNGVSLISLSLSKTYHSLTYSAYTFEKCKMVYILHRQVLVENAVQLEWKKLRGLQSITCKVLFKWTNEIRPKQGGRESIYHKLSAEKSQNSSTLMYISLN